MHVIMPDKKKNDNEPRQYADEMTLSDKVRAFTWLFAVVMIAFNADISERRIKEYTQAGLFDNVTGIWELQENIREYERGKDDEDPLSGFHVD